MRRVILVSGGLLASAATLVITALLWPLPEPAPAGPAEALTIEHVAVVDIENGTLLPDRTVLLRDGRIQSIAPSAETRVAADTRRLDGRGRFLIPGLWDMHTHSTKLSPQLDHPLQVAHGVTSVRDMSGCLSEDDPYWACPHDRRQWDAQRRSRGRITPRHPLQSSYQTNGGNEVPADFPAHFRLATEADAAATVAFYRDQGVDFIKTYTELRPQQYAWLAHHALAQGLTIAGHQPVAVSLREALAAGQRSIEHGRLFLFECFAGVAAWRALPDPLAAYDATMRGQLIAQRDEVACDAHRRAMARAGAWWVPTLTTLRMPLQAASAQGRTDPRLAEVPAVRRRLIWDPDADRAAAEPPSADGQSVHAKLYRLAQADVARAHSAGVRILVGTDTTDTFVFAGSSLHDELAMLVDAGLSPAQALRAATLSAAVFAGAENDHGTVAVGKVADLVMLDADPLTDIRHTRHISAVFLGGRHLDATRLNELRAFAREQAASWRVNLQLAWQFMASPLMRQQIAD